MIRNAGKQNERHTEAPGDAELYFHNKPNAPEAPVMTPCSISLSLRFTSNRAHKSYSRTSISTAQIQGALYVKPVLSQGELYLHLVLADWSRT